MHNITISERELDSRPEEVRKLLRPLGKREVACSFYGNLSKGGRIIAAHSGNIQNRVFNEWKFPTSNKDLLCGYYELWKPVVASLNVFLDRAYLTIYTRNHHEYHEYVCVHCDPNDTCEEPMRSFKLGPHLHIKKAEHPLPKSHFPLNYSHLDQVLSSPEKLTSAWADAVKIIKHEVIDRFE